MHGTRKSLGLAACGLVGLAAVAWLASTEDAGGAAPVRLGRPSAPASTGDPAARVRAPEERVALVPPPVRAVVSSPRPDASGSATPPVVAERAWLTGLVSRPDGAPAARAVVRIGGHRLRCDADGRYAVELPVPAAEAVLVATLEGYEPVRLERYGARLAQGARADHAVLVLGRPTTTLAGIVLDAEERPRKQVVVELVDAGDGPAPRTTTDGTGAFRLVDVPAGRHRLRVRIGAEEHVTAPFEAGREDVCVVLGS